MYYDSKSDLLDDDDETEKEEEDEDSDDDAVVKKKSKAKASKSKKSTTTKQKQSAKKSSTNNKSSKASTSKKSRAIIEDDDDDDDDIPAAAATMKMKSNLDDDDDDEDEEEDDDIEAAKEEFNDFIDDNVDEEEEEEDDDDDEEEKESEKGDGDEENDESNSKRHKKTRKKKKDKKAKKKKKGKTSDGSGSSSGSSDNSDDNSELEEDDLDLIKDNLKVDDLEEVGINAKKRKRIKIYSESSEEETQPAEEEKSAKEKKKLKRQSKQTRDDQAEEVVDEDNENKENAESDEGSFIVDDSDDENKAGSDEDNQARARRSGKDNVQQKKKRVYNDEAQQEALDIFGVDAEELGAISDDSNVEDEEYDEDLEEEIEEEEDDEALEREIEEEDDLKAAKKRQRQRRLKVMHKIEDIFEPQELEKNLLTEFDQQIRIEDKPERFMLRTLAVTIEPDDSELEREAEWIFNQAFQAKKTISNQERFEPKPYSAIQKIKDALNFIRNEFLEVPFIAFYRKEHVEPELTIQDLWKVFELDEKYCQLKQRKENLIKLFERMRKYQQEEQIPQLNARRFKKVLLNDDDDEATEVEDEQVINHLESMRLLTDQDIDRVRSVQTTDEFLDCNHHFHLHYSADLIAMKEFELKETIRASKQRQNLHNDPLDENQDPLADIDLDMDILDGAKFMKYASRKDKLFHCKQAGLDSLAKKFGLTSEQYGENLLADYQKHEIDQCDVDPTQLAMNYVKEPYFQSTDQVLATVKYMLAIQMAREPSVRQYVRELYMQNACITVRPTMQRGFKEIDEVHACFPFKYLKQKPCADLKQDEFLKLIQAEQDGLLTVKFETLQLKRIVVDEEESKKGGSKFSTFNESIVDKLKGFYQKDEFSYNVEQWNAQRAQLVEDMCNKFLFPDFEKEIKSKLLAEAKQYVFGECGKRLGFILGQGGCRVDQGESSAQKSGHVDYNENGLNVISIVFTSNETDENGVNVSSVAIASFVNGAGELDEFVRIRNFNVKVNHNASDSKKFDFLSKEKEEKQEDLNQLEEFILKKRPDLIIIGSENKDALLVQDDVKNLINNILDQNHTKLGRVKVELIDNEIAKLFEASKQSEQEFGKTTPGLVKQSVCLARYVQDPLLCYAQFCNQERDILSLKLHPMQQSLLGGGRQSDDASELLRVLEIEFVNKVNEVGVDLNRCNQCPHTSHVLQFVSGLGPRKAQHIIKVLRHQRSQIMSTLTQDKQIKTYPVAMNRLFLVTKCTLGRRVFINCAGFIKFDVDTISKEIDEDDEDKDSSQITDDSKYTEILDSTRIHPETYDWARKMAIDALDKEDEEPEPNPNAALKEILDNPKRLKDLDLDAFAAELVRTGHGNKNITLYDIRKELMFRYKDLRGEFVTMSSEEKFYTLIKETPQTFYVGKLVLARCIGIARRKLTKQQVDEANPIKDNNTCMWECQFCKRNDFRELSQVWSHFDTGECPGPPVGVRSILDNGCNGFIPLKLLSDSQVTNPEERIKIGMTVHARITRIDPERFSVELTCRTSDLRDVKNKWKPEQDKYYDFKTQEEDQTKLDDKKKKEDHRQTYTKRIIAHPQFKNIGYSQAVAYLRDMDIGDAIIRPSSKGNDHLTVTWKLNKHCYQHIDVLEEKKINSFSVGKRLIIDGEDYEDLDEILARYVSPMANCCREIMTHKNYKEVEFVNSYNQQQENESSQEKSSDMQVRTDQIELFLQDERAKSPAKIPYLFTCCRNLPGRFMLSYMIKTKLRNEYIKITQDGFKFREKLFNSFTELVNWFKVHYNDPLSVPNITALTSVSSQQQQQNSAQKISNQISGMSISSQSTAASRTPSYPASTTRTPLHQTNAYDSNDVVPTSSFSNEYVTNNQINENNVRNDYSGGGRGGGGGSYRGGANGRGRGGGGFRGRGGGGRGGAFNNNYDRSNFNRNNFGNDSNNNDWDNRYNTNNNNNYSNSYNSNNYNSSGRFGNEEDWSSNENSSQMPYQNRQNFSRGGAASSSSNRNENWADSRAANTGGNYNRQTNYNNYNQRFNNNNNTAPSSAVGQEPRKIDDDEDWD